MRVSVKISGNTAIIKRLQTLPKQAETLMADEVEATTSAIHQAADSRVPVDTGRLKGSLTSDVVKTGTKIVGEVGTNVGYAPYIEFGTRSNVSIPPGLESYAAQFRGRGVSGKDFEKVIMEWMRRKGIPEEALYPIMMKLLHVGIHPKPFLFNSFFEKAVKLPGNIEKGIAKLVK